MSGGTPTRGGWPLQTFFSYDDKKCELAKNVTKCSTSSSSVLVLIVLVGVPTRDGWTLQTFFGRG